jgi:hypothetical protein
MEDFDFGEKLILSVIGILLIGLIISVGMLVYDTYKSWEWRERQSLYYIERVKERAIEQYKQEHRDEEDSPIYDNILL